MENRTSFGSNLSIHYPGTWADHSRPTLRRGDQVMPKTDYTSHLRLPTSAYFFRKHAPLSAAAVRRLLGAARAHAAGRPLQTVLKRRKVLAGYALHYSFVIFREEFEPPFLEGTNVLNVAYGFLLLCELHDTLIVLKSNAEFDSSSLGAAVSPFAHGELRRLFANRNPAYEKIGVRTMLVSEVGVRGRTLEADDLKTCMSTIGANRSIPLGLRIRVGTEVHTVTPNTSRIGKRAGRANLANLLQWAIQMEAEVMTPQASAFTDCFASPCRLADLPAGIIPTGVLCGLDALAEGLNDQTIRRMLFSRVSGQAAQPLDAEGVEQLLDRARQVYEVTADGNGYRINRTNRRRVGNLRLNKSTITISSLLFDRFVVEYANGDSISLTKFLNLKQDFVVSFSDPRYAYCGRHLFRDDNLLTSLDGFLSVFIPVAELANVNHEKGSVFAATDVEFDILSVFGVVQHRIATLDAVLFCDDLDDEWADCIGVCSDAAKPGVTFYVAKHDDVGLGASPFQIVAAQAQKNLGHLNPSAAELGVKQLRWATTYVSGTGVHTAIPRTLRGGPTNDGIATMQRVLGMPLTTRRMCLVVSFVSKQQLTAAFTELRNGNFADRQLIQLLWLVSAYIGNCRDAGAIPHVYCAP